MRDLYIFIVGVFQHSLIEVTATQIYQLYRKGDSSNAVLTHSEDFTANSKIHCGIKCRHVNCHAFHFEKSSKLCKLATYNYIGPPLTPDVGNSEYFFKDEAFLTTTQPLLDCPSTSSGNVTALMSSLQFTFRITLATVSHTQAWAACRDAGERLMKIETVEKQAAVQYIVNTCPDVSSHDYWLDGYYNATTGWIYADGTSVPMNTTHLWAADAPNNGNDDICIRMRAASGHRWDDYTCSDEVFSYICEPV